MLLGARQFFASKPAPALPYDAEVEYLESAFHWDSYGSNSPYIDTGVKINGRCRIDAIVEGLSGGNVAVFGSSNTGGTGGEFALFWNGGVWEAVYPTSNSTYNIAKPRPSYQTNTNYDISFGNGTFRANASDATYANYDQYECVSNLYLFCTNRRGPKYGSYCRVYRFKVYDGNVLVCDMIPVRFTNSNGQSDGAMYDRVSGALFRNAGTGAFTIGPDKS